VWPLKPADNKAYYNTQKSICAECVGNLTYERGAGVKDTKDEDNNG